jgi:hypothetical protein
MLAAVDANRAASADDRVDLLLPVLAVVVFRPFRVWRQLELVDPEGGDAERLPDRLETPF